jgi:hypothetical protein
VSREVWWWDHDLSDEEWKSITEALGKVAITGKDRSDIIGVGERYLATRSRESAAKRLDLIVRPTQIAERLEGIYKAAWKLRRAMASTKFDNEILPEKDYVTWEEWSGQTHESEAFQWRIENWNDFIAQLGSLERQAKLKARRWESIKSPHNIDPARDEAWGSLAEIYVRLTGDEPRASPRTSKAGKYAKGYAGFVEAFMAVMPGEGAIGDDDIPNFLRTERCRERMQKFLDAHHGLLRVRQRKKPPKRS